jgi:hypothetical protein
LCLHTGSISLLYLCVKDYSPPVPQPQTRNGAHIPMSEGQRGLRAGLIT